MNCSTAFNTFTIVLVLLVGMAAGGLISYWFIMGIPCQWVSRDDAEEMVRDALERAKSTEVGER